MDTYSFLDVVATLVGPGGFVSLGSGAGASEEGISIDPTTEIDSMQIGADGQGMHSLHADKSGKVVVRLLKTSPTNAVLASMYAFQTASGATHGQNTITVVDSSRQDVITCRQVAFAKAPPLAYGKEAGLIEWEFNAVAIDRALGS
jgi:hypothetical protein